MRPGPHPWAEDDTFTTAPDIGSDNKLETTDMLRDEGVHRSEQIGPDLLNWQLNRGHLAQQMASKMFASNLQQESTPGFYSGYSLVTSTHYQSSTDMEILHYFLSGTTINEVRGKAARSWGAPSSNPVVTGVTVGTRIDADANDANGRRAVVFSSGVRTNTVYTAGAWSTPTGTGGKNWTTIGCDRDTAGGAGTNGKWLIGDDGVAGSVAPVVYASTDDLTSFANVAGFPSLPVGQYVLAIGHTCHPAGALGTDDAGNPSWLVITDDYACVSADGVTWTSHLHGLAGLLYAKSIAYSRTARRWVMVDSTGAMAYSDDNGANWVALGSLPGTFSTGEVQIKCDGYGTFFLIDDSAEAYWVSADDGITWTYNRFATLGWTWAVGTDTLSLEVGMAETLNNWNSPGAHATFFDVLFHDNSTGAAESHRSLVY